MEIRLYEDIDLSEYLHDYERNSWGGAYDRLKSLDKIGKLDAFIDAIINDFIATDYDVISKTELNDFIWFECDDLIEDLEAEYHEENNEEEE